MVFFENVKKVLDNVDEFCESLEKENLENINSENDNSEIEEIVAKIKKIKTHKNDRSDDCTKKKVIGYLYLSVQGNSHIWVKIIFYVLIVRPVENHICY